MLNTTLLSLYLSKLNSNSPLISNVGNSNINIFNSKFTNSFSHFFYSSIPFKLINIKQTKFTKFGKSVLYVKDDLPFNATITFSNSTYSKQQIIGMENIYITDCIFEKCHADNENNRKGGAIFIFYSKTSEIFIQRTTFAECAAYEDGGAVSLLINACYLYDICAYQCSCGTDNQGHLFDITSNNCTLSRCTLVECASELAQGGSASAKFSSGVISLSDWNETLETSQIEGGIIFGSKNDYDWSITRIIFDKIYSKKMLYMTGQVHISQIALISCHAEESLLTPNAYEIHFRELYVKSCSNVLVAPAYNSYHLTIEDSYFDKKYDYDDLCNCSITDMNFWFELDQNYISNCADGIKLYSNVNTKTMDVIMLVIVLFVLIGALSFSFVWYCFLHIPNDDDIPKIDQNLKMSLPLADNENELSEALPALTLKI